MLETHYKIKENEDGLVHMETPLLHVLTLCGWVDVLNYAVDEPVDCPQCLEIIAFCKKIRKPNKRK